MRLQPREESPDRPLRICLLTYRGNPTCGGQGVYIKRISRVLAQHGHEVHVVSGPPYPELDAGIPLHRLPSLDLYNPEQLFRTPELRELRSPVNMLEWLGVSSGGFPEPFTFGIRAFSFFRACPVPFDVVHDNQGLSYGLLGIPRLGFPMVATIHHPVTYDRKAELEQERRWWKRLMIRRWYSFVGMQVRVARRLSHIITVSECSKRDTARAFGIPAGRFRVVQNGIDTDIFRPLPQVKREDNRIIVTNSADSPVKGVRYLLEAVASIARKRDIFLTVVGAPKKNGVVEKLVCDLDLGRNVEFAGRIEDKDFPYYYARSTMAVVPSIYEGFGFPAGEAMACGIPVVSTTGGALPEVVGDAGLLVPPADSQALERAILTLLDNPEKQRELSRAGFARIHRDFHRIPLKPGFRVLDAGCGAGRHLGESFRRSGVHVVGVDRSADDIVTARNTLRAMEYAGEGGGGSWITMRADVTNLPFADASFDLVICSEVLEHIPDDDRAIREIVRVLKPGESLAVSVPSFFPETVCWALSKTYRNDPGGHVRVYRKNRLLRKLERSGVRCVSTGCAHALHSPYWWLKCACGLKNDNVWPVRMYHRMLVWDIIKRPWLTRTLDRLLNPLMAKSCVLYLEKTGS